MTPDEEELQRNIEAGITLKGESMDIKAYKEVFRALKHQPQTHLSPGFADKIVNTIKEKHRREESRDHWWFGLGLFFILIAFVVAVVRTGFTPDFGFLSDMSGYAGLLVFGIVFVLILNRIEKKLLSGKQRPV